jgi:hypothetical protein
MNAHPDGNLFLFPTANNISFAILKITCLFIERYTLEREK